MIKIAPSILSADWSCLSRAVKKAEKAGCDLLHIDVMDGSFVPNITFGPIVVDAVRKLTKLPLDIHLMIKNPGKHIKRFIEAGGDIIIVHVEACGSRRRVASLIEEIENYGKMAGVALKLETPLSSITHVLDSLHTVLLMAVNPGFAGQTFNPRVIPKIEELRRIRCRKSYHFDIEVDGGITPNTAPAVIQAGATILIAGTAVFGRSDIRKAIRDLRDSVDRETWSK